MNILLLTSCVLDPSTFSWGFLGQCFVESNLIGLDLSWIFILIFFVLMVLMGNLRIGVWYSIAGVLTSFLLVSVPGNSVVLVIWAIVIFLIPALMFIPAFKKFVDR
jgi:hypothetical protein